MTSNYDEYIRPEVWPVAPHLIAWVYTGRASTSASTTIRGAESQNGARSERTHVLCVVPTRDAPSAIAAIEAYCDACRKLIG